MYWKNILQIYVLIYKFGKFLKSVFRIYLFKVNLEIPKIRCLYCKYDMEHLLKLRDKMEKLGLSGGIGSNYGVIKNTTHNVFGLKWI